MGWFSKKQQPVANDQSQMGEMALRSVHDGVVIVNTAGNVVFINPAACTLLSLAREEALALDYLSAIHLIDKQGNTASDTENPITIALKTNEYSESRIYSIATAGNNKAIPISLIITPSGGPAEPKIITLRNIAKELKEEEDRNEFISTASHEMRTPVASIEGYLALAMNPQTATIDARAASYLAKAHEASQHLGHLFQDLLDTTKLDDGKMKLRMQPVEMTALVHSIADTQAPNIAAKGLKYQFNSATTAPSTGAKQLNQLIYAEVDIDYLREIIGNIIENSIKYTPAGAIAITVTADQETVRIIVSDSGIGIPRDEIDHIFQKFYRIDNSDTREIGGTGLGLHITKQRTEQMGGRIWAESELGRGTSFFVSFPRLSTAEYQKRRIAIESAMAAAQNTTSPPANQPPTPKTI